MAFLGFLLFEFAGPNLPGGVLGLVVRTVAFLGITAGWIATRRDRRLWIAGAIAGICIALLASGLCYLALRQL